jgi:hypothetical protein
LSPNRQPETFTSTQTLRSHNSSKIKSPTGRWHCNHPPLDSTVPVPIGPIFSYGSVPAKKIVPSWRNEPRDRTRKTTS